MRTSYKEINFIIDELEKWAIEHCRKCHITDPDFIDDVIGEARLAYLAYGFNHKKVINQCARYIYRELNYNKRKKTSKI